MTNISSDNQYDVVIIGNGVLGLSLGIKLLKSNKKVIILGENVRPMAATIASGAMLGTFGEVTASLLKSDYGRLKHDFAVRSKALWNNWLTELNEHSDQDNILCANGTIVMLNTVGSRELDTENYEAIRNSLLHYNENFQDIDPKDIEWLDAETTARPLRALHIPNEHAVDSGKLLNKLENAFLNLGGHIKNEEALEIETSRNMVKSVKLKSGFTLNCEQVVLAAGVRTQELLDKMPTISERIPSLVSGYGVSAIVETEDNTNPEQVIRTPNRAFACGLHVVPRGTGQVYVGATNIIKPNPMDGPHLNDVTFLLDCAYRQVNRKLATSKMTKLQVGNRPISLDGYPLLGETDMQGLWLMTGTYRDGLTISPYVAEEMSKLICGEETSDSDFNKFSPVRRPIQTATREEIIEEAMQHMIATGYEFDWRIPVEWQGIIEYSMKPSYVNYTENLDTQYTPPADLLAASRVYPSIAKKMKQYYGAWSENISKDTVGMK